MKILLTVHLFFPHYAAGTEVLTYSVARELISRGHEVRVLTAHPTKQEMPNEKRFDEYRYEGIRVYRFHHADAPTAGQSSRMELNFDNHLAEEYFKQILKEFKPDVVHFFHLNRLGTGLIAQAVHAGIPTFFTPTDFWAVCPTGQLLLGNGKLCSGPSAHAGNCVKHFAQITQAGPVGKVAQWLPTAFVDLLVQLTQAEVVPPYPHRIEVKAIGSRLARNVAQLNQLNKIISPNSFMTKKLVQHGVLPDLIVQSAYGIDISGQAATVPRQETRQPFRIGFVGTLAPHKGCHVLIEAFKALPVGAAILKIYGSAENFLEYSSELRRLAGQQSDIEFCGIFQNSKIADVMTSFDALVVPSLWYENTPLVLYSAQAAYCSVVASDFPGISAVIQDRVNGLLFEAGNSAELAKQLLRLINEPNLARQLRANTLQPKSTVRYVDELLGIWEGHELAPEAT